MSVLALALAALVAIVVSVIVVASHAGQRAVGHNNVLVDDLLENVGTEVTQRCQDRELVPAGTGAVRVSLSTGVVPGPAVRMRVLDGRDVVTAGRLAPGWTGDAATVPVRPVERAVSGARVCLTIGAEGAALLRGSLDPNWGSEDRRIADRPPGDRFRIDYMSGERASWLAHARVMARRLGLNSALRGPWTALLPILFMLAAAGIAVVCLVGDQSPPRAALACALVGVLNAASWALISPPFQFLDEQDHFAYVQHVGETGRPPGGTQSFFYSPELSGALRAVHQVSLRQSVANAPIWSPIERERLDRMQATRPSRTDTAGAGTATGQPPLYYALAAVPYRVRSGGSLLERLLWVRLLSVLFAGVAALFAFLFVRETLPAVSWAWTVGGLAAALQPVFGFASGAASPDSLLFAVAAALFYCLARGFRRGLTMRLSVAIGLLLGAGMLIKIAFVGLVPGALLGLAAIAWRQRSTAPLQRMQLPAVAIAVALVPIVLVGVLNSAAWDRNANLTAAAVPSVVAEAGGSGDGGGLAQQLGVVWEMYLPRLPGMASHWGQWPFPAKQVWLDGFVGSFGWHSIYPPKWVTTVALLPATIALILFGIALVAGARELRRRLLQVATYALMIVGLLALVGLAQYTSVIGDAPNWFGQPRYLLPLLAPFAAVLALAARGAGRWGRLVGVLVVMLALMHVVHSQLLTVSHYYG